MGNNSHQVEPSRWVERWAGCFPLEAAILDVAGGAGRHARFLLGRGHDVTVVDRDCSALKDLNQHPRATVLEADLESCVPFLGSHFGVVLVTNFLLRTLFPHLIAAVAPGGYLVYETFTTLHARYRRPRDRRHLAAPGELQNLVTEELDVVAYEEVVEPGSRRAAVARLAATRR
jgi:SAM-dependent methyltransferase